MKSFFPKICPSCGQPLVIEQGDKSDTLKLMCKNKECSGSLLKRLQKGIIALEIRGLGPAVIESLMNAGITSSLDLFDPEKFNEKVLISSGEFKKGRSLEKIITVVKSTKSIPLHKFILSLQIDDCGKTVSEKLAQLMSGLKPDFAGLPYVVRDNMNELVTRIKGVIELVESQGVEIVRVSPPKIVDATKVIATKIVAIEANDEIKEFVEKLGWNIVSVDDEECQMFICIDKSKFSDVKIKIMTLKQIKLLFG